MVHKRTQQELGGEKPSGSFFVVGNRRASSPYSSSLSSSFSLSFFCTCTGFLFLIQMQQSRVKMRKQVQVQEDEKDEDKEEDMESTRRDCQKIVYGLTEDTNLRAACRGELRVPHGRREPEERRVSLRVAQEQSSSSGERVRAISLPRLPTKRSSA